MSTWLDHEVPKYLTKHYFWVCMMNLNYAFKLVKSVKQFVLSNVSGDYETHWGSEQNKKAEEGRIQPFLPDALSWDTDVLPSACLVFRPSEVGWITPQAFVSLQLVGSISGDFWDLLIAQANFLQSILSLSLYIYTYIYIYTLIHVCVCIYISMYVCMYFPIYWFHFSKENPD